MNVFEDQYQFEVFPYAVDESCCTKANECKKVLKENSDDDILFEEYARENGWSADDKRAFEELKMMSAANPSYIVLAVERLKDEGVIKDFLRNPKRYEAKCRDIIDEIEDSNVYTGEEDDEYFGVRDGMKDDYDRGDDLQYGQDEQFESEEDEADDEEGTVDGETDCHKYIRMLLVAVDDFITALAEDGKISEDKEYVHKMIDLLDELKEECGVS